MLLFFVLFNYCLLAAGLELIQSTHIIKWSQCLLLRTYYCCTFPKQFFVAFLSYLFLLGNAVFSVCDLFKYVDHKRCLRPFLNKNNLGNHFCVLTCVT